MRPEDAPSTPDMNGIHERLGNIGATLRDVKDDTRTNSSKIDALAIVVATFSEAQRTMTTIQVEQEKHHNRISLLEADRQRRDGAISLAEWVSKHWPFTLLGGLIIAFVAFANGKIG